MIDRFTDSLQGLNDKQDRILSEQIKKYWEETQVLLEYFFRAESD